MSEKNPNLIDIKDHQEAMIETLEILSNPDIMEILKKAKASQERQLLSDDKIWGF